MMHWGPSSEWGVVESWSICSEDWIKRPAGSNYVDYKARYQALPKTFNPVGFNPDVWAEVARGAGMKYVVFTTKHHDGFLMFDTKQTDYRITAPDVPFHTNPRANIANEVFAAFRKQQFGIGAYFSIGPPRTATSTTTRADIPSAGGTSFPLCTARLRS